MTILVIAEHDHQSLKAATLNTVAAAQKIGGEIHVLVAGSNCSAAAQEAANCKASAQSRSPTLPTTKARPPRTSRRWSSPTPRGYSHILAPATTFGKNLAAARRCLARRRPDLRNHRRRISPDTFVRPIYAGNALATVKSADPVKVITVRTTAFDATETGRSTAETVPKSKASPRPPTPPKAQLQNRELTKSERPELGAAKIIVSGGRGLGSGENYHKLLEPLADKLGAALGASRAAVDAGFVPNDYQVGQTGKIVAPQLYIAVGISGAIQHLAGMKESKVIVAINKDPDAPIFQVADYGLVGDLFEVVPQLAAAVG